MFSIVRVYIVLLTNYRTAYIIVGHGPSCIRKTAFSPWTRFRATICTPRNETVRENRPRNGTDLLSSYRQIFDGRFKRDERKGVPAHRYRRDRPVFRLWFVYVVVPEKQVTGAGVIGVSVRNGGGLFVVIRRKMADTVNTKIQRRQFTDRDTITRNHVRGHFLHIV